jgi:predicted nucleic acid-binding protein
MKYILDTGPLVALLGRGEKHQKLINWARNTLSALPWPMFTCEAVLTETAHFTRDALSVARLVEAENLVIPFSFAEQAADIARIIETYDDRVVSLADACLVRMTELYRESTVITIDVSDFSAYRRFNREPITLITPPQP